MSIYLQLTLYMIAALAGLCIGHAVVSRVVRYCGYGSVAPQTVLLGTVFAGNIPVGYLAWALVLRNLAGSAEIVFGLIYVLLTYNAYSFCYFSVLNLSETSLHVNILMRLLIGGGAGIEELAGRYSVRDMIGARIDRMIALGQLRERNGRYLLQNRTLVILGRAIRFWRFTLGLPLSHGESTAAAAHFGEK